MSVVKRICSVALLVACLLGVGFVVWDTAWRGRTTPTNTDVIETTSTTSAAGSSAEVDRFPITATKNPYAPLVQLPPTATTQPKT